MLMCARDCNIGLRVHRIAGSKILQSSQNSISDGSVAGLSIENKVHKPIIGIAHVSNDESSRVDPLAQSSSNLAQAGISLVKVNTGLSGNRIRILP